MYLPSPHEVREAYALIRKWWPVRHTDQRACYYLCMARSVLRPYVIGSEADKRLRAHIRKVVGV